MELLQEGAALLGQELAAPMLAQFSLYLKELKQWNAHINLTGLKTDRDIVIKHFLDSLAILPYLGQPESLVDLGSGAGFPSLVIKIMRPFMSLTLVEGKGKKAAFLEYVTTVMGISGVRIVQEHLTPRVAKAWGPRFAAVVSRAAFTLPHLLELGAPLLLPRGRLLALKGSKLDEREFLKAQERSHELGLQVLEKYSYTLPLADVSRLVLMAEREPKFFAPPNHD